MKNKLQGQKLHPAINQIFCFCSLKKEMKNGLQGWYKMFYLRDVFVA